MMIEATNLSYSYRGGDQHAIQDISFSVDKGEVFSLLGPSGAGKSTTQGILTGLLPLQKGSGHVAGHDLGHARRAMFNDIGVSFEQSNVYGKLTALENLNFYRRLFDAQTLDPKKLLQLVGLEDVMNQRADTFSKGMKHRLTFARSMINQPKLWFLDEPTTGLDPAIARKIRSLILQQKHEGTTIFLTTHNMMLADALSDRIGFIVDGHLELIDTPRNLKLQYGQKLVEVDYKTEKGLQSQVLSLVDETDRNQLKNILDEHDVETMHTREATLEEIFIKVTGRELT